MTGEILFLAHRIPFPPDRGDKIRSHHIVKALAALAPVHVGTFADDAADEAHEADLASTATTHYLARRSKPLALAGIMAVATGRPVSLAAFADPGLRDWVRATLAARPIATIYVFSSQMAQYVPADFTGRVVMDFVDVDSAKFEAYAHHAAWPLGRIHAREGRLLAAWEAELAHRVDVSLFVTDEEAALFHSRLDPRVLAAANVRTLGNGIDLAYFAPGPVGPAAPLAIGEGPHLLFTGQMDYPPNVAAAVRFATRIMPEVRRAFPAAGFHVAGRKPVSAVVALEGRHGTRVWGAVDDMREWLTGAAVVVAPLEIARGIQNKVLEAMAMARPVIASIEAATGIAARDGVEIAIADGDVAFVDRTLELLADAKKRAAIGAAARKFVVERQSWATMLTELPEIVGFRDPGARHAA